MDAHVMPLALPPWPPLAQDQPEPRPTLGQRLWSLAGQLISPVVFFQPREPIIPDPDHFGLQVQAHLYGSHLGVLVDQLESDITTWSRGDVSTLRSRFDLFELLELSRLLTPAFGSWRFNDERNLAFTYPQRQLLAQYAHYHQIRATRINDEVMASIYEAVVNSLLCQFTLITFWL